MRRLLQVSWTNLCILLTLFYLVSSLSAFIPPRSISFVSVLGLGFPYILGAYVISLLLSFRRHMKLAVVMLFLLPAGIYNSMHTFAMGFAHKWRPQKDSATLRVMTWNVQSFAILPAVST